MHNIQQINTAVLCIRVSGANARSFRQIDLLEFEEEEENIAPSDTDDDNKYERNDPFCAEDDEKHYSLWSSCDDYPFALLVQLCGQMICTTVS